MKADAIYNENPNISLPEVEKKLPQAMNEMYSLERSLMTLGEIVFSSTGHIKKVFEAEQKHLFNL